MTYPRVFNLRNRSTPMQVHGAYIGRGSRFGNAFVIGPDGTRDEVCDKFETFRLPHMDVDSLRGKDMYCYCTPDRCHGHAIFKKLYGIEYFDAHPEEKRK